MELPLQRTGIGVEEGLQSGLLGVLAGGQGEELLDVGGIAADERDVVEGAPAVVVALVPGRGATAVDGAL
jgi:hypothetical protein